MMAAEQSWDSVASALPAINLQQVSARDIRIEIVGAIQQLPADYARRIENFFTEYIGTPMQPALFGGRDREFAELDDWLSNGSAPPYMLLASPAGRGKSALLAQWTRRLLSQRSPESHVESGAHLPELEVIFIPVSVRFRTNLASVFFAAFATRLSQACGEPLPRVVNVSDEEWRSIIANLLAEHKGNEKQLLVIVDGLDEAADWSLGADLFPLHPPEGVRVIVSARFRAGSPDGSDWLNALGWNTLPGLATLHTIGPLSEEAIGSLIKRVEIRGVTAAMLSTLATDLRRITEGDPLLTKLYLDDLRRKGVAGQQVDPRELASTAPGLSGYFARWWAEQRTLWGADAPLREPSARALLNILATALGPLQRGDIIEIAPADADIDTWQLGDLFRRLARLVIGDGQAQGYVFSHPRLAAFFYDELSAGERRAWEERFTSWGARAIEDAERGKLLPSEIPSYLLEYLPAHLERQNASPASFVRLLSNAWRQAWEAFEGSYSGYLRTLAVVQERVAEGNSAAVAANGPAPFLADELSCILCKASVSSLAHSMPPVLITRLAVSGLWTPAQALTYARLMPNSENGLEAIRGLLPLLNDSLLETVLSWADGTGDADIQAKTLEAAAPLLHPNAVSAVLRRTLHIEDPLARCRALAALIARTDGDTRLWVEEHRVQAMHSALHEGLEHRGPFGQQPHYIGKVAAYVSAYCLPDIRDAVTQLESDGLRSLALEYMTEALAKAGRLHDALAVARSVERADRRVKALAGLVPHLPRAMHDDVIDRALAAAQSVFTPPSAGCESDARTNQETEDSESKYSWMAGIDARARVRGTTSALLDLMQYANNATRVRIVRVCLESIGSLEFEDRWVNLGRMAAYVSNNNLSWLAQESQRIAEEQARYGEHLAQTYQRDDTSRLMVDNIRENSREAGLKLQVCVMLAIAPSLPEEERIAFLENARRAAAGLSQLDKRVEALCSVAAASSDVARTAIIEDVLRIAEEDEHARARAVKAISPLLNGGYVRQVLRLIHGISRPEDRNEALTAVVPHLPSSALEEAAVAARWIGDASERLKASALHAAFLSAEPRSRLLTVLLGSEPSDARDALVAIAPYVDTSDQRSILNQLIAARHGDWGMIGLVQMADLVPDSQLDDIVRACRDLPSSERFLVLSAVARRLSTNERAEVIALAADAYFEKPAFWSPRDVARLLSESELEAFWQRCVQIVDSYDRQKAMHAIAAEFAARGSVAHAVLLLEREDNDYVAAELLVAVVESLPPTFPLTERLALLGRALDLAWGEDDDIRRHPLIGRLAALMPDEMVDSTLERAHTIDSEQQRAWLFREVLRSLPLQRVIQIIEAADNFDERNRNEVFSAAACRLAILGEIELSFSVLAEVTNEFVISDVVGDFADSLPIEWAEVVAQAAVTSLGRLGVGRDAVKALPNVLLRLPAIERYDLWWRMMESAAVSREMCAQIAGALASVTNSLGVEGTSDRVVDKLVAVGQWWP